MSLADGLGITVALSLVTAWPGTGDSAALTAMVVTAGAFACLPFGLARWHLTRASSRLQQLVLGIALALLVWGVISVVGSSNPWAISIFGWFGRADGLLMLAAVVAILVSTATLTRREVDRVITWLLVGGAVLVLQGMAQLLGATYPPMGEYNAPSGALGNPNFFAATCAILALLAGGRALASQRSTWQRWSCAALALGLVASAFLSRSDQGPAALAVGLVACGVAWVLQYRGRRRGLAVALAAVAVVAAAAIVALAGLMAGPLGFIRDMDTIKVRESFWEAAWRTMVNLPVFGTGPDGFARYVGEFRTESYLTSVGSTVLTSAAHNVPLQYGATFGWVGLAGWLALMVGTAVILVRALIRGIGPAWLDVSLAGAWVAYLAQAMVSIDAPALKALGWLVTGLILAVAADRESPPARRAGWLPWAAGAAGLAAVIAWWAIITPTTSASGEITIESAVKGATNPLVSCPIRLPILANLGQVLPPADLAALAKVSLALDVRCPLMAADVSRIALEAGDLALARQAAEVAVKTDPLSPRSWETLSLVLVESGDNAGAEAALAESQRLASLDLYGTAGDSASDLAPR